MVSPVINRDPNAIPDFSHLDADAPGVVSKRDRLTMAVDYQLMVDNLMDLSHASFLHRGILGNHDMLRADLRVPAGIGVNIFVAMMVSPDFETWNAENRETVVPTFIDGQVENRKIPRLEESGIHRLKPSQHLSLRNS